MARSPNTLQRVMPHHLITLVLALLLTACGDGAAKTKRVTVPQSNDPKPEGPQLATFGAGCFWCVEAVFQRIEGVTKVEAGYTGGNTKNPTYRDIGTGMTGHAEVAQLTYDPEAVDFRSLLEVFFSTHDPTTLNRQGADRGTQYRSAIFYHSEEQRRIAEEVKAALNKAKAFDDPIVTEVTALGDYYEAEDYHQNYYNLNPDKGYCRAIIKPKVEKLQKVFADRLKKTPSETPSK